MPIQGRKFTSTSLALVKCHEAKSWRLAKGEQVILMNSSKEISRRVEIKLRNQGEKAKMFMKENQFKDECAA